MEDTKVPFSLQSSALTHCTVKHYRKVFLQRWTPKWYSYSSNTLETGGIAARCRDQCWLLEHRRERCTHGCWGKPPPPLRHWVLFLKWTFLAVVQWHRTVRLKATSSTHSGIKSSVVLTTPCLVAETRRKEESLLGSCSKGPLVRREHGDHQWRQLTLNLLNVREWIKEKKPWCPVPHPLFHEKRKT